MKLNCSHFLSGILSEQVFVFVSFLILLIFIFFLFDSFRLKKSALWTGGLTLIVIGGAGNLIERLMTGCVRDYINFFNLFHFNLFDLFVTLGISFTIITIWQKRKI
jgi:signal peptidase II